MNYKFLVDSNDNMLYIVLLIILAITTFIVLIVYFFVSRKNENHKDKYNFAKNTIRVITINYKTGAVKYFDKNNISAQHECTFSQFLEFYSVEDGVRIEKWLEELFYSKKDVSDYLEADTIVDDEKRTYFSFLQVKQIDKKRRILHLEKCIMKNMDIKQFDNSKDKKRITTTNIDQMFTIENLKDKNKGSFLYVSIRNTKLQDDDDDKVDSMLFTSIKNIIIPYLKSNCSIADYSQSAFTIFYPGISKRRNLLRMMQGISKTIARYLEINSYVEKYTYAISGCILNSELSSYKKLVRVTRSISPLAFNHPNHFMIYDENIVSDNDVTTSYESEFNSLIEKKDFKIFFQPIVDITKGSLLAYSSTIVCNNTIFGGDIQELKEYAYKMGKNKELFSLFNKRILARYKNENNSKVKLIYNVSVLEKDFIAKSFSHVNNLETENIILAFNEIELSEWLQDEAEIVETLENLKEHGFALSLVISRKESLLTSEIMQLFDYFIIDRELTRACSKLGRSILIVHAIIEELKNYQKDIIAYDLDTTNSLYLLTKMGINLVSSNLISQSDEMILPIDTKRLEKVMSTVKGKN
ncbi:MAG: EAL domain-containing protein [Erysipelotrichales bacterium]|nr:EAL domain-containing protein [Erysipelotrichales bacterium]